VKLFTNEFGAIGVQVVKGNSNSCVDAYAESGYKYSPDEDGYDDDLDDAELDLINLEYSAEIQEWAVKMLGCYYD
jgi:hypothetical protein